MGEREPKRIQRRRTPGWRMPEGAVYVGRGTRWGNPFGLPGTKATHVVPTAAEAKQCYYVNLLRGQLGIEIEDAVRELRGKDLACWCDLDAPCHADDLLYVANRNPEREG